MMKRLVPIAIIIFVAFLTIFPGCIKEQTLEIPKYHKPAEADNKSTLNKVELTESYVLDGLTVHFPGTWIVDDRGGDTVFLTTPEGGVVSIASFKLNAGLQITPETSPSLLDSLFSIEYATYENFTPPLEFTNDSQRYTSGNTVYEIRMMEESLENIKAKGFFLYGMCGLSRYTIIATVPDDVFTKAQPSLEAFINAVEFE